LLAGLDAFRLVHAKYDRERQLGPKGLKRKKIHWRSRMGS